MANEIGSPIRASVDALCRDDADQITSSAHKKLPNSARIVS